MEDSPIWPNPTPLKDKGIQIDDVSRLNATHVGGVFQCRDEVDVIKIISLAKRLNRSVTVRGTSHSMGGQSICEDALIIDTARMKKMAYDEEMRVVTVGAGALWCDVILYLNQYGMSPRTMQSYSSFSVGGSLAVNVHGVTTDECLAESIVSFKMVTSSGEFVECSPGCEDEALRELFSLVIGGIGLFGIVTEVCLRVNENYNLEMIPLLLSTKEFIYHYDKILESKDIEVKLARLDLSNLNQIDLFLFRKTANSKTVSDLPLVPRKMSATSRIFYKWLAPTIKELRFTIEHNLGIALDWNSDHNKQRNLLMFESAEPLARLFEPIFRTDDTFILQEYFIPKKNFLQWIEMASPVVNELNEISISESICSLLNITIRFVKKDDLTFLKYSREENGVFAFVLYFRIHRSEDGDNYVKSIHEKLVQGTLNLQGTFYLPYRHHYTIQDLQSAYPNVVEFWEKKLQYDPECLFKNMWWDKYGPVDRFGTSKIPLPVLDLCPSLDEDFVFEVVSERRNNSFRNILDSPTNSALFREGFLENIFNIEDSNSLYRKVAKVCWDIRNKTDDDIYVSLQEELNNTSSGPISSVSRIWKQINQLHEQKEELLRETLGIVGRLGKLGHLHDYVSIGDHGKMVSLFKEKLLIDRTIQIVHDEHSQSVEAILERGDTDDVGQFNMIDYENPKLNLPDISADLITMNQGLHHLPQDCLIDFLQDIYRVLRPGGLFIVREHDWDPEIHPNLLPMLDIAHMVFNAGTGVSHKNERLERRAFRSIRDWIKIISSVGFVNSMLYDMQDNDPTWDEMMCFYKPPLWLEHHLLMDSNNLDENTVKPDIEDDGFSVLFLNAAKSFVHSLNNGMGELHEYIRSLASNLSTGQQYLVNNSIENFFEPLQRLLVRFIPLLDNVQISSSPSESLIPPEINLLIRAIIKRVDSGTATPMEMMAAAFIKDFESAVSLGSVDSKESSTPPIFDTENDVTAEEIVSILENLLNSLPELKESKIIEEMGFSFMATRAAMKFHSSLDLDHDLEPSAVWISKKLDRKSWERLIVAFDDIIENHILPSIDHFVDQDNPWHEVCLAIFSSPHIEFSRNFSWKASAVGLGDILQIYKKAKSTETIKKGSTIYEEEISEVIGDLEKGKKRKISMMEGALKDIHDVYEIVDAKYGYKSITADFIDCTDALKKLYLQGSSLHLKGKDLTTDFGNEGIMPWKAWDDFRTGLRGKKRKLIVRYRRFSNSPDSSYLEDKFDAVIGYLKKEGWIGDSDSGHLTWFKLVEWLQVEMINQFGQSMNHTPWYRFPFIEYIRDYFKILIKETLIVREKFGWGKAIFSTAFMVDLIPGIVMSFIMLQMQLLAIPLKMIGGDEYETASLVEQLTIFNPVSGNTDFKSIHEDIIEEAYITKGLYSIKVPTFKRMTNVVTALSKKLPTAYIIDISGNTEVQVKVKIQENSDYIDHLESQTPDGCQFKMKFSQSMDLDKNQIRMVNYAFEVKTLNLLPTIKWLHSLHISSLQIYDFFH